MNGVSRSALLAAALILAASGSSGPIETVAGLEPPAVGTIGEDGPADQAALNNAEDVVVAPNGDIYIADYQSSRLLRIRDGILTVAYRGDWAGGENDFSGVAVADDGIVYFTTGLAVQALSPDGSVTEVLPSEAGAQVYQPKLAVLPDGSILLAGGALPRIDRIAEDGSISQVGGDDELATIAGEGDGGPATEARFNRISGIATDSTGATYVADEGFGTVRRIDPDGVVTTVFGGGTIPPGEAVDGTAAVDVQNLSAEIGISVDEDDNLYIVPRLAGKVYRVEDGLITTVAGGGSNPGTGFDPLDTQLSAPVRVAISGDDLFILVEDGRFLLLAPGAAAAGALVDSVPSPADINLDPLVIAASVVLTAGMLFLVPFPAEIFNNTLVEHHDRIKGWFRRRDQANAPGLWSRWWVIALAVVAMALLYGFLDPGFGIGPGSVPLLGGLLVGVAITTLGFLAPTRLMRRRASGESGNLRVLPVALLVAVGCVLLSRLIGFLPGYLYGIALGLIFAGQVGEEVEAREVLTTAMVLIVIAFGSWFGLGAVRNAEPGALTEFAEAALAMTTVAAFEGLVFGLLPIHGMPGRVLFRERRLVWLTVWGLSVLAFFHVLVNPQSGYLVDTALVPTLTTYALLGVFTLVSVGLWAWFRRQDRKTPAPPGAVAADTT